MKHHIAVKFLAVFLASLALLGALASGLGITGLTALGLYEGSVDELYAQQMGNTRQNFAVNLLHRYASLNLGHLPQDYLNQYYGTHWQYDIFEYGRYFYTIKDEHGNVVETTANELPANVTRYLLQITELNYKCLVQTVPWGEEFYSNTTAPTEAPSETAETESIPPTTQVSSENTTEVPSFTQPEPTDGTIDPGSSVPMDTQPETAMSDSIELASEIPDALRFDEYYDHELGQQMRILYTIQELPPYTVELYLLPGAMPEEHIWSLLRVVWPYREELFYVLGVSLLLFAIFSVYLCCAAGKKPGRAEIKAGGLNCLPLDLYALAGGGAICLTCWFGVEAAEYLLRSSPQVLVPFVAIAGYGCCLILVSFCFACAAQFKTPGLYWIKNAITGRCFLLLGKLWNISLDVFAWLWARIPRMFRWCFTIAKRILLWAWKLTMTIWGFFWRKLRQAARWCAQKLARMYSLLPLTWQWLLVGGVMFLLIGVIFASNGEEVLAILCMALFFGIILYGAHAFGILMEGAKRMGKGDLETKVSDQFLLGSFKDFAKDLNALADVAVVAAQKQMKSERMKTELITNVSHDIKTPLTSIINYVDLLNKAETDEERETYLEVLSRQSQQLKKLIEDLMEMSKASTGNMNVDISSVNAAEAINQALGEFADKLDRAQLIPVFRQPENPIYMQADGRLAWRVMSNLLSNAVKYALPGTRVYIDLMELEGKVIISMKNISREELNVSADELLERFVRGDVSRNTEGSGLGLNIAQSLMEIQKGQLQLLVDGDLFKVTLVFPAAII